MEQSMSVPTGTGEQNLTPGEQRILLLLEQGQQRMEQRLQSLEDKLNAQAQRLQPLKITVDHEAAASKRRDQELTAGLQHLREEGQARELRHLETVHREMSAFQREVSERFDRHTTRLELVEQMVQLNSSALQGLQQEVRKLAVARE
jgi:hypothetical protein